MQCLLVAKVFGLLGTLLGVALRFIGVEFEPTAGGTYTHTPLYQIKATTPPYVLHGVHYLKDKESSLPVSTIPDV